MRDEFGGKIMKLFIALRPKMCSYLMVDGHVDNRVKSTKKGVKRWEIKFKYYKSFLENSKIILKSKQRFRCEAHNVFEEKFKKVALYAYGNDGKRMQMSDRVAELI